VSRRTYDTTNLADRDVAGRLRPGRLIVGVFRILATLLFILSIPTAFATTTVRYVTNEQRVYRYAIDQYNGVATTGISRDELLRGSAELRQYFNDDQQTVRIRVTQQGKDVSLFNPRETDHLKDVKSRLDIMNKVQEFSVLYLLIYVAAVVLWAREITLRQLSVRVMVGCLITLLAIGGTAAFASSGFDLAWVRFHEVLFSGNWRFNPATDHLIQMFPPAFWQSIVFFIGVFFAIVSIRQVFGPCIEDQHHRAIFASIIFL